MKICGGTFHSLVIPESCETYCFQMKLLFLQNRKSEVQKEQSKNNAGDNEKNNGLVGGLKIFETRRTMISMKRSASALMTRRFAHNPLLRLRIRPVDHKYQQKTHICGHFLEFILFTYLPCNRCVVLGEQTRFREICKSNHRYSAHKTSTPGVRNCIFIIKCRCRCH